MLIPGALTITAIGHPGRERIRRPSGRWPLMCKMTGTDIHHLGDAGYAAHNSAGKYTGVFRGSPRHPAYVSPYGGIHSAVGGAALRIAKEWFILGTCPVLPFFSVIIVKNAGTAMGFYGNCMQWMKLLLIRQKEKEA